MYKTGIYYNQDVISRKTEKKELIIPNSWGMYTSKGNNRLKQFAKQLIIDLQNSTSGLDALKALMKYYKRWRRLHSTKTMGESGDTAVRECVADFGMKAAKAFGYADLEERAYEESQ